MELKVNVAESFKMPLELLLREKEITPKIIVKSEGFDGISIWKYVLDYGPDTLRLITAIIALWNEIQKVRQKGEKQKIEIILENDDD